MNQNASAFSRRSFVKTLAAAGAGTALGLSARAADAVAGGKRTKLGFDNFSVRAMGWKAPQLLDYAASLKLDSLFITNLDALENFENKYLGEVRAKAKDLAIDILLGSWSICPTSKSFRNNYGTAEEHLTLGIRLAKALGSPVLRVIQGTRDDRKTSGGIEARIDDTVRVLKSCRSQAVDAGVKIAVENHAGDMQAWEIARLVELAGKDYVGVTYDSGNATWALEDPIDCLEQIAPYVVATHLRDSMLWEYEDGVRIQWTATGEGCTDTKAFFARFAELCPGISAHVEIISGFNLDFPVWKSDYWQQWPKAQAPGFAKFIKLARAGKPMQPFKAPEGVDRKKADQDYQKAELERSLSYCKGVLGLGLKA